MQSSPLSLSLRLSPQPKRFSIRYSWVPFFGPSTQNLMRRCLLSSEKMMEEVDLSQTMPLGKAKSVSRTADSLVLRLNEIILPSLCLYSVYLLANLIEMEVESVIQTIWFSSSRHRLFKAAKPFPSIPPSRNVGVFVSRSNLINPANSVTKQRVLSSLVMTIPQMPLVLLNLYRVSMPPLELMVAKVPSARPVQIVPSFETAMSSGYFRRAASVIT